MGTLEFHFSNSDRTLIERAQRGDALSPNDEERLSLLNAFAALNSELSEKPDQQISRDGYGVEDGSKQ
ncbi:hypothetical protein I6H96_02725 [Brucella anthropi]|uniref:hypothetical protein n=1 Tax=Brucella anthropi TaxID=529 RepID=UPI0002E868D2|nr:hypothetical protein [Brucella anthropi]NKC48150.1 hypothetical protein [Brucella anthropi ATCC 49188]QQC25795.1 hypothetical protein I6H96_02725 [Brucella anthropi]RRY08861.1 hypothetical protein EGJ58_13265 [Brucella anthropi]SUA65396.1 Uncharacterised protein [Brucella anthropi]